MKREFPKPRFAVEDKQTQYFDNAWERIWAITLTFAGGLLLVKSLSADHHLQVLIGSTITGTIMLLGLALGLTTGTTKVFVLHTIAAMFSAACVLPIVSMMISRANPISNSFMVIVFLCLSSIFKWIGDRTKT